MRMRKGEIEKEIPKNLVSDYQHMGWQIIKPEKATKTVSSKEED